MKLSMETYALRQAVGDFEAIKLIKKAGFDSIDYSFYNFNKTNDVFSGDYKEYANKILKCMTDNGITGNQAHAPFAFVYGDDISTNNSHYEKIVKAIEFASIIKTEYIIIHCINTNNKEDLYSYNREFYKSLEKYSKKFNILIAVENLFEKDEKRGCWRGVLGTPYILSEFIKSLSSDRFVACLDLGHSAISGIEPEDFIKNMDSKLLKTLHVHDNDYRSDKHYLPYTGSFNWNKIMEALKKSKYEGDLTLEVFGLLKNYPTELLPEILKLCEATGRHLIKMFNLK